MVVFFIVLVLLQLTVCFLTLFLFLWIRSESFAGMLTGNIEKGFLEKLTSLKIDIIKDIEGLKSKMVETIAEKNAGLTSSMLERMQSIDSQSSNKLRIFAETIQKWKEGLESAINKTIKDDFDRIRLLMDEKLKEINQQVQTNIEENFKKTTQTFEDVLSRLIKIDEAQKNIEGLSKNVISLQDILMDKKSRGAFGEVQLHQVLSSVFGESKKFYELQFTFRGGEDGVKRADAVMFFPEPTGKVCIDSKFPLENYQRMIDAKTGEEKKDCEKKFVADVKSRIAEVQKYVISGETADFAIMFVPSEVIFAQIVGVHHDVVALAQSKRVYIASPTTLMAICNTLHAALMKVEVGKNAEIIKGHLAKLSDEFDRYYERWTKLENQLDSVTKSGRDVGITSKKIRNQFVAIKNNRETSGAVDTVDAKDLAVSDNSDSDDVVSLFGVKG